METYDKWPIAYPTQGEDHELEVRRDPHDPEGYSIHLIQNDKLLMLPRGTLREVAKGSRTHGREVLQTLLKDSGPILNVKGFFKGTSLNYDSLIAVIAKTYINEEVRRGSLI